MSTETQTHEADPTFFRRFVQFAGEFLATWRGRISVLLLAPILLGGLFAPWLAPYDPTASIGPVYAGLGGEHLLGTDHLGRDLLSRLLYGIRTSLLLGISAALLSILLGTPIGIISGYEGGRVDEVMMRLSDALLSFPSLLLALLVVATIGSNLTNAVLAIAITYTPKIARITRSSALSIKNEEYIKASIARGESRPYIWFGEMLPNAMGPIIVEGTIRIGFAILIGTSLSFLGLGTQPPTADLGYMIATARNHIFNTPWFLLWPSVFLSATILGFNLLGDALNDVLNPEIESNEL